MIEDNVELKSLPGAYKATLNGASHLSSNGMTFSKNVKSL